MPHFDYCSPDGDCLSSYLSDKLQKLQNSAARVITKSPFDASSNHLLSTLSWEKLSLRRKKQKALMMYKTMNDLFPEYLQSLFSERQSAYNLRNSEGRLTLSKPSTNYLKRSFSIINSQCSSIKWIERSTEYVLPRIQVFIYLSDFGKRYPTTEEGL